MPTIKPDEKDIKLYVRAQLLHWRGDKEWCSSKYTWAGSAETLVDLDINDGCDFIFEDDGLTFIRQVRTASKNWQIGTLTTTQTSYL
jgi:hypothetical protein